MRPRMVGSRIGLAAAVTIPRALALACGIRGSGAQKTDGWAQFCKHGWVQRD